MHKHLPALFALSLSLASLASTARADDTLTNFSAGYGAAGVPAVADRLGGRGRYAGSFLGTLAGGAAGYAIMSAVDMRPETAMVLLGSSTLLGAIVGYELSAAIAPSEAPAARPAVTPMAAITPDGAHVGLAGTF